MTTALFTEELRIASELARQAGALAHRMQSTGLAVEHKAHEEPVTAADRAANQLIVDGLRAAFPDDAILSEEVPDDPARLEKSRVWMIDPIDGTRDFLRGEPGYVVMIGLCVEGRPRVGVVVQPTSGNVWMGALGAGAWKETPDGKREPLHISGIEHSKDIRLVSSKSHRTDYYERFRRALGITDEFALGSVGLKVALVAEGSRDLYVYPGSQTKIWDSCGPDAILTAAGGKVTDCQGNRLCYTNAALQNPCGLVASNGLVHAAVLRVITGLG
jgi:3'(2'), 5'-bisphosphate nucleotidase